MAISDEGHPKVLFSIATTLGCWRHQMRVTKRFFLIATTLECLPTLVEGNQMVLFSITTTLRFWPTVVEGDPKASFQLLLHRNAREGATPFPGLLHFTLDPYSYNAEC